MHQGNQRLFTIDCAEPPDVYLAPAGTPWELVTSFVERTRHPVLAADAERPGTYTGVCWDGAMRTLIITGDLGPGHDIALAQFRASMRFKEHVPQT